MVTPEAGASGAIRVLVVDDHPLVRDALTGLLGSDPGFEIIGEAGTTAEAAEQIADLRPDLAIVDLRLPDGDGTELCAELQAEFPTMRLLVLTRTTADRFVLGAFESGIDGFLVKTSEASEILAAVRSVADGGTYIDPKVAHCVVRKATRAQRSRGPYGLSNQELAVMRLVHRGLSNRGIAAELGLSIETVMTHLRHAMAKVGADDPKTAARTLANRGLL